MSTDEILEVVDKNNIFIKTGKRSFIHRKGLFHRTANVFVINPKGEIFIQQRSNKKTICPLYWDLSVAEHLKIGESYLQACFRGLKEELGIVANIIIIRSVHLQKNSYFKNKIKDFEFAKLYLGFYDKKILINKKEIKNGKFISIKDLDKKIKRGNNLFTPWFLNEWQFLKRKIGFKAFKNLRANLKDFNHKN